MVRLLHISDTHLLGPGGRSEHPEIDAEQRLRTVLDAAAASGPFDAVAVTGDIADDGSREAVLRVRDLVAPLAAVTVAVPGNHDRAAAVGAVFEQSSVRIGGWQVLHADTTIPGEISGRAHPVLDLLDRCTGPSVVLMHHPLRSRSTHPWFVLDGARELEQRLRAHPDPLVLLSGHTHEAFEAATGTTRILGAPSTFYGIAHDGERYAMHAAPTGARVVDLADDGRCSTSLISA